LQGLHPSRKKKMMKLLLALVVVLAVLSATAFGAYCSGKPDEGERVSAYDIHDGPLVLVKEVKNAKLYEAGPEGHKFSVVHLWGTPYEVGYAQGILQRKSVIDFTTKTWAYLMGMLVEEFPEGTFTPEVEAIIATKGMDVALDWAVRTTAPFTPQAYLDEMRGLSDATGLSYDLIYRLNMFPELSKGILDCVFFLTNLDVFMWFVSVLLLLGCLG
jgi:isopenicillin-N N-acyltransferase-like protein